MSSPEPDPGESSGGGKRRRVEREDTGHDARNSSTMGNGVSTASHDDRLRALLSREAALLAELQETRREIEQTRLSIRSEGNYEHDSLLSVGLDSLSLTQAYLDPRSVGRCEKVCKELRRQAEKYWTDLDGQTHVNDKSSADDARTRAIRYHLASNFARRVEPMTAAHVTKGRYGYKVPCKGGCNVFPGEKQWHLDTARVISNLDSYEIFIRFSNKQDGYDYNLLAQGFVEARHEEEKEGDVHFWQELYLMFGDLNLSGWLSMKEVVTFSKQDPPASELRDQIHSALQDEGLDLVITVVAIRKGTSTPDLRLISAACGRPSTEVLDGGSAYYNMPDLRANPHEEDEKNIANALITTTFRGTPPLELRVTLFD